jgi:uncharacterized protein
MECPWCYEQIEPKKGYCPACKHEIFELEEAEEEGEPAVCEGEAASIFDEADEPESLEQTLNSRFKCFRCSTEVCIVNEVSMTGPGLSKMFDIQHKHYLFVSCAHCGYVEVYDPNVLRGHSVGRLGTVLDVLFGG